MGRCFQILESHAWALVDVFLTFSVIVLSNWGKRAYAAGNMHTPQACIRHFLFAFGFRKIFGQGACRHLLDTDNMRAFMMINEQTDGHG